MIALTTNTLTPTDFAEEVRKVSNDTEMVEIALHQCVRRQKFEDEG